MDELDLNLSAWREATERLAPPPAALAALHNAIEVEAAALTKPPPHSGAGGVSVAKVMWWIASIAIGVLVAGGLSFWLGTRSAVPSTPAATPAPPSLPVAAPVQATQLAPAVPVCDAAAGYAPRVEAAPAAAPAAPAAPAPARPMPALAPGTAPRPRPKAAPARALPAAPVTLVTPAAKPVPAGAH